MLRVSVNEDFFRVYETLLGIPVVTREPIPRGARRQQHLAIGDYNVNMLFDPDTGLRMKGKRTRKHLMSTEFVDLVKRRPRSITAVFDQGLSRGNQREDLVEKVRLFSEEEFATVGYYSHACFVLASVDSRLVERAKQLLIKGGVPEDRLVG